MEGFSQLDLNHTLPLAVEKRLSHVLHSRSCQLQITTNHTVCTRVLWSGVETQCAVIGVAVRAFPWALEFAEVHRTLPQFARSVLYSLQTFC